MALSTVFFFFSYFDTSVVKSEAVGAGGLSDHTLSPSEFPPRAQRPAQLIRTPDESEGAFRLFTGAPSCFFPLTLIFPLPAGLRGALL